MQSSEKKWFDLAIERKYLVLEGNKGKRVKNAYYDWCVENQRVFICVRKSKNTATIQLHLQADGIKRRWFTEDALEKYLEIVIPYMGSEISFEFIKHVPNSDVDEVVESILELLAEGFVKGGDAVYSMDLVTHLSEDKTFGKKSRNPKIAKKVKKHSKGICELCSKPAPFKDRNGQPYLEAHHIIWMARGGNDTKENLAALCPNCHRKMHILDLAEDRAYLKEKAKKRSYEPAF